MAFTPSQFRSLAIAPKITGPLSMFGSGCIVRAVLSDKSKLKCTYHKILFVMSALDFVISFWFAMSTWPIPVGTPNLWGPAGNGASCSAQGFFIQLNTTTPLLNSSLSIYYLLVSRYQWSEERLRKIELGLIGIPLLLGFGTAIAGFPLTLYNNANLWCWISSFPAGCKDSARYGDAATCIRGDNAWIYRWAFSYAWVWSSIVVATGCMLVVYWTVLQQERAVDKFQDDGLAVRKQSKRVAWQGFWYILAFYTTWIPPTLVRLLQTIPATKGKVYYPIIITMATLLPLQGFLNFIVYSRARFHKYKRENPAASMRQALKVAAFSYNPTHSQTAQPTDGEPQDAMEEPRLATEAILQSEAPEQKKQIT